MTKNVNEVMKMVTGMTFKAEKTLREKEDKKNADYYKALKFYKLWNIIEQLVAYNHSNDEIVMEEFGFRFLKELCGDPKEVISVNEGDNILELLNKYADVKDSYNKIRKACETSGLKIEGSTIVKA